MWSTTAAKRQRYISSITMFFNGNRSRFFSCNFHPLPYKKLSCPIFTDQKKQQILTIEKTNNYGALSKPQHNSVVYMFYMQ